MREWLPFVLVFLAIFSAGCIAYIAWELSAGDPSEEDGSRPKTDTAPGESGETPSN